VEPNSFSAQTIFAVVSFFLGFFVAGPLQPKPAHSRDLLLPPDATPPAPIRSAAAPYAAVGRPTPRVSSWIEAPPSHLPFPLSNSVPRRLPSPFYSMKLMASLNLHCRRWPDASHPLKGASSTTTPHHTSCCLFLHLSVLQSRSSPITTAAACSSSPPDSPRRRAGRFRPRWGLLDSPLPFPFVAASSRRPNQSNDMTSVSLRPAMVARPWWTGMPLRSMAHGLGSQFFLLKNKLKIQLILEILAYSPLSFIEIKV
jgi:hypothetical protein